MSKATPGPWQFTVNVGERLIVGAGDQILMCDKIGNLGWVPKRDEDWFLIAAAPNLLAACEAALEHVTELRDAWMRGALSEHDSKGGTRSNRNAKVEVQLRAAIQLAGEPSE